MQGIGRRIAGISNQPHLLLDFASLSAVQPLSGAHKVTIKYRDGKAGAMVDFCEADGNGNTKYLNYLEIDKKSETGGSKTVSVSEGGEPDRRGDALPPAEQPKQDQTKAKPEPSGKPRQAQPAAPAEAEGGQTFSIPPFGPVPLQDEVKIGRQIAGNLLGAAPLVKDAKLQQYVNRVGRWVGSRSGRPDLNWTFGVIESNDINAFAAPGGYIFVTRGLYVRLKDEAELAGVLAHEVAHVQQQHHLKVLQQQQLIGLGRQLLGKQIGGDAAVQRLIGSGAEILARGLDKSAEFEADRIGVVLATRAGYDPWGLPSVLQEIGSVSQSDAGGVALLFKTHPHPDERLSALGAAMGEHFDGVTGKAVSGRLYRLPAK